MLIRIWTFNFDPIHLRTIPIIQRHLLYAQELFPIIIFLGNAKLYLISDWSNCVKIDKSCTIGFQFRINGAN